jgi:c-di-GMP-binding flagellar brake protein YcgR
MSTRKNIDHLNTGKRISLELGTQLEIEIGGVLPRFKSSLVGIEPDEYLIIKCPEAAPPDSVKDKLFRGNQIVIRYLFKGTVFGFQSQLVQTISTPKRLLFVEYPRKIEEYDLRSDKRIDCFLPAKIEIKDEVKNGAILDISEGGCHYQINMSKGEEVPSVQIGELISLRCQFPGAEAEQLVSGKIRNFSRHQQKIAIGVGFHEIAPEVQNIIAQYISTVKEFYKLEWK